MESLDEAPLAQMEGELNAQGAAIPNHTNAYSN